MSGDSVIDEATQETLGVLLVRQGLVTREQLYDALRLQRQNNRLLGTCLMSLGYVGAKELLQVISGQLKVPMLAPGMLAKADPKAVALVPGEVALRLRVVPYSFDGQMLGVAIADGRVLAHLHEVAHHSRTAVGAYLATELEIEAALARLYQAPNRQKPLPPAQKFEERPRPVKTPPPKPPPQGGADLPLPSYQPNGGPHAARPMHASSPVMAPPALGAAATNTAPSPGPQRMAQELTPPQGGGRLTIPKPSLERLSLYDAVEKIYEAEGEEGIGRLIGQALHNYFRRAMVFAVEEGQLRLAAFGGGDLDSHAPERPAIAIVAIPDVADLLAKRTITYGPAAAEPAVAELCDMFGVMEPATALMAPVHSGRGVRLLIYADNGAATDLYEDLHDIEMLFKEAETALEMMHAQQVH